MDDAALSACVVSERQICTPVKLSLVLFLLVGRASCSLDSLSLLVRVTVVAVCAEVGPVVTLIHSVSKQCLFHVTLSALGRDPLARRLRLPHAKLLGDEAVFDHLIYVLFLGEGALVVEVEIAHLLADVLLVNTLGVPRVPMIDQALSNEGTVETSGVRRRCPLLVPTRLYLILAQENSFAMDLLEGDVCRGKVVVIDGVLVESVHGRVSVGAALIQGLL